jgi:hypothetical protein
MMAKKNNTPEYLPYVRVVHNVEWIATSVSVSAGSVARVQACCNHCCSWSCSSTPARARGQADHSIHLPKAWLRP